METDFNNRIIRLMQLHLLGTISEEERKELESWCQTDDDNQHFFEQICGENVLSKERMLYLNIDEEKAYRQFRQQTKTATGKLSIRPYLKYAAILLLPLLFAGLWLWNQPDNENITAKVENEHLNCSEAVLILDNGERIALSGSGVKDIINNENVQATKEQDRLVYKNNEESTIEEPQYNTLEIPRGREYIVTLTDGSTVHINSASQLKFPEIFTGKERRVILSGEAYFEICKNAHSPFIVETNGIEIKVYGTSFNVTSRDSVVRTVLEEGSVGVKILQSGTEQRMIPGEMATCSSGNESILIEKVNTALYTNWRKGILHFENRRLEDILTELSYWYNIEIVYQSTKVKNLHYSGYMERFADVNRILEAISLTTGVTFTTNGNRITVSE